MNGIGKREGRGRERKAGRGRSTVIIESIQVRFDDQPDSKVSGLESDHCAGAYDNICFDLLVETTALVAHV